MYICSAYVIYFTNKEKNIKTHVHEKYNQKWVKFKFNFAISKTWSERFANFDLEYVESNVLFYS